MEPVFMMLRTLRRVALRAASFGFLVGCAVQSGFADVPGWWMNEKQLKGVFAGQLVHGHYANGLTFKERYEDNGRVDYRETGLRHSGRWSVTAGTFCTIYDDNRSGGCFRVRRHSANCFEFYFVARTEAQAEVPDRGKPAWTARAWIADKASTCTEDVTV